MQKENKYSCDTTYRSVHSSVLKEKLREAAFKLRMKEGDFVYDRPEIEAGLGPCEDKPVHTDMDGHIYLGQWLEGTFQGRGTRINKTGYIEEGYWKDNKLDGKGRQIFNDGRLYEGDFQEGFPTGKGVRTWANGDRYEGDFDQGNRSG